MVVFNGVILYIYMHDSVDVLVPQIILNYFPFSYTGKHITIITSRNKNDKKKYEMTILNYY